MRCQSAFPPQTVSGRHSVFSKRHLLTRKASKEVEAAQMQCKVWSCFHPTINNWSLLLWRHSRPAWTRSSAACCRWPCFSRGVGLDDPQRSLPTPNILWFCNCRHLNFQFNFTLTAAAPPLTVWLPTSWLWVFSLQKNLFASQAGKTHSFSLKWNMIGSLLIAGLSLETRSKSSLKNHNPEAVLGREGRQGRQGHMIFKFIWWPLNTWQSQNESLAFKELLILQRSQAFIQLSLPWIANGHSSCIM